MWMQIEELSNFGLVIFLFAMFSNIRFKLRLNIFSFFLKQIDERKKTRPPPLMVMCGCASGYITCSSEVVEDSGFPFSYPISAYHY